MDCQCTKIIRQFLYRKCLRRHLQVIKSNICLIEDTVYNLLRYAYGKALYLAKQLSAGKTDFKEL